MYDRNYTGTALPRYYVISNKHLLTIVLQRLDILRRVLGRVSDLLRSLKLKRYSEVGSRYSRHPKFLIRRHFEQPFKLSVKQDSNGTVYP